MPDPGAGPGPSAREPGPSAGEPGPGPGLATLAAMGTTIVVAVLVGLGLGWLADRAAGTTPLFIFVGLAFGIVAAALGAYRVLRTYL